MNSRAKNILVGLALVMIAALIAGIINIILNMQNSGKYGVTVDTSPTTATVTINGNPGIRGMNYLKAGTYTVTASKDGYQSKSETITVRPDKVPYVGLILTPLTDAAKSEQGANAEQSQLEAISGQITEQNSNLALEKTPLIDRLPYLGEGLDFRIDFGLTISKERSDKGYRAILISAGSPETRQEAIKWIRSVGEDPSKYEIDFLDYHGPIKGSGGEDYDEHF